MSILFIATEPGHLQLPGNPLETYTPYNPKYCREGVRGYWGNEGGAVGQTYTYTKGGGILPSPGTMQKSIYLCGHITNSWNSMEPSDSQLSFGLGSSISNFFIGLRFIGNTGFVTVVDGPDTPFSVRSNPLYISPGLHKVIVKIDYMRDFTATPDYQYTVSFYTDDIFRNSVSAETDSDPNQFFMEMTFQNENAPRDVFTVSEIFISDTNPSRTQLWTRTPQTFERIDSSKWMGSISDIDELLIDNSTFMECTDTTEPYVAIGMSTPDNLPTTKPIGYASFITASREDASGSAPTTIGYGAVDDGQAVMNDALTAISAGVWANSVNIVNNVQSDATNRVLIVKAMNQVGTGDPVPYP